MELRVGRPSEHPAVLPLELFPRVLGVPLGFKQVHVGIPGRGGLRVPELAGRRLEIGGGAQQPAQVTPSYYERRSVLVREREHQLGDLEVVAWVASGDALLSLVERGKKCVACADVPEPCLWFDGPC